MLHPLTFEPLSLEEARYWNTSITAMNAPAQTVDDMDKQLSVLDTKDLRSLIKYFAGAIDESVGCIKSLEIYHSWKKHKFVNFINYEDDYDQDDKEPDATDSQETDTLAKEKDKQAQ